MILVKKNCSDIWDYGNFRTVKRPRMISIFQSCLLPKMRLFVDLEGIGYDILIITFYQIRKFLTVVDAVVVSSWSFFKRLDGAGGGHFPRILAKFETWLTCSEAFVAFVTSLAVDFCKPLWLLAAFFLAKKAAAVVCWSLDPVQKKYIDKIFLLC